MRDADGKKMQIIYHQAQVLWQIEETEDGVVGHVDSCNVYCGGQVKWCGRFRNVPHSLVREQSVRRLLTLSRGLCYTRPLPSLTIEIFNASTLRAGVDPSTLLILSTLSLKYYSYQRS